MNKVDRHVPVYAGWQWVPDTEGIELNYFYRIIYNTVTYEMQEEFSAAVMSWMRILKVFQIYSS